MDRIQAIKMLQSGQVIRSRDGYIWRMDKEGNVLKTDNSFNIIMKVELEWLQANLDQMEPRFTDTENSHSQGWAARKAEKGIKVRLREWHDGSYLVIDNMIWYRRKPNGEKIRIPLAELAVTDTDWVLAEIY